MNLNLDGSEAILENGGVTVTKLLSPGPMSKLLGEAMKIFSLRYNEKIFAFEVECTLPGHKAPGIYVFDNKFFPNHLPLPFLDEKLQVGESVHVWIKEEAALKNEGWKDLTKHTLGSPDSPFKIGKAKKVYLGGAHKGTVCLDEKFNPFVAIKGFRFSPIEIQCVVRLENMFVGTNAEITSREGKWKYEADKQVVVDNEGNAIVDKSEINVLIDLFRRARLI